MASKKLNEIEDIKLDFICYVNGYVESTGIGVFFLIPPEAMLFREIAHKIQDWLFVAEKRTFKEVIEDYGDVGDVADDIFDDKMHSRYDEQYIPASELEDATGIEIRPFSEIIRRFNLNTANWIEIGQQGSHSFLWNKHYAQRADLYSGSKLLKSVVICEEYQDKNWPTRFREVHRLASQIDSECEVSDSVCNDDNDSDWEDDGEDDE